MGCYVAAIYFRGVINYIYTHTYTLTGSLQKQATLPAIYGTPLLIKGVHTFIQLGAEMMRVGNWHRVFKMTNLRIDSKI